MLYTDYHIVITEEESVFNIDITGWEWSLVLINCDRNTIMYYIIIYYYIDSAFNKIQCLNARHEHISILKLHIMSVSLFIMSYNESEI